MMQPPFDFLRCGIANRLTSNMAVRLTATTLSQASGGICSTGSVSPAMPALLISTSSPPSAVTASGTMRSISARTAMSQWLAITPGISWTIASIALSSMSQMKTCAPLAAKARANSRPMPAAPAVINTFCGMGSPGWQLLLFTPGASQFHHERRRQCAFCIIVPEGLSCCESCPPPSLLP